MDAARPTDGAPAVDVSVDVDAVNIEPDAGPDADPDAAVVIDVDAVNIDEGAVPDAAPDAAAVIDVDAVNIDEGAVLDAVHDAAVVVDVDAVNIEPDEGLEPDAAVPALECPQLWSPRDAVWVVVAGEARAFVPDAFAADDPRATVLPPDGAGFIGGVALPGGLRAILHSERAVHLVDLVAAEVVTSVAVEGAVVAISVAPDAQRVAVLFGPPDARVVAAFDVAGLVQLNINSGRSLTIEAEGAHTLALADDGRLFVNGLAPQTVSVFELLGAAPEVPAQAYLQVGDAAPGPLALSPDGAMLFAGWDDVVVRHRLVEGGVEAAGALPLVQGADGFFATKRVDHLAPVDGDTVYALFHALSGGPAFEELQRVDFSGDPTAVWQEVIASQRFPRTFGLALLGVDPVSANLVRDGAPGSVALHRNRDGQLEVGGEFPGVTGVFAAGPAQLEVCNGRDDDCDGDVDEGLGVGEMCDEPGVCGRGVRVCRDERPYCNALDRAGEEGCNGADDDCDGAVDEQLEMVVEGPLVAERADQGRVAWASDFEQFGVVWRDTGGPSVHFRRYSSRLQPVGDAPLDVADSAAGPDVAYVDQTWGISFVGDGGRSLDMVQLDGNLAPAAMPHLHPVAQEDRPGPVTLFVDGGGFTRATVFDRVSVMDDDVLFILYFDAGVRDPVNGESNGGGWRGRVAGVRAGRGVFVGERGGMLNLLRRGMAGPDDFQLDLVDGREPAIAYDVDVPATVLAWSDDAGVHLARLADDLQSVNPDARFRVGPPGASAPTVAVGAREYLVVYVFEGRLWAARMSRTEPHVLRAASPITSADVDASEPHLVAGPDGLYGLVWKESVGLGPRMLRITSGPVGCGIPAPE